jgi:hypothetical protein
MNRVRLTALTSDEFDSRSVSRKTTDGCPASMFPGVRCDDGFLTATATDGCWPAVRLSLFEHLMTTGGVPTSVSPQTEVDCCKLVATTDGCWLTAVTSDGCLPAASTTS